PGVHGAEIVVGDGQPLGNPPSFGGPSLGFFAARAARVRRLPGRIAGGTIDRDGQAGCVLTFQTREQHIRRERATSNICTNQGLCATRGTIYMALLGKRGLQQVARTCFERAHHLAREAARIPGFQRVGSGPFFNELVIETTLPAEKLLEEFQGEGVRAGLPLPRIDGNGARERQLLVAVTEMNPPEDLEAWLRAAREIAGRNGWKA
ncbi:MAG: glycine dehydrogenase, partial [Planctomycetota bacterium]